MSISLKSTYIFDKEPNEIIFVSDAKAIIDDLEALNETGAGTVSSFAFTNANGFTGIVANPTTNPNLTLSISDAAVTSKLLTGFVTGANSTILATDTLLGAFQKTQGQINARVSGSGTTNTIPSFTSSTVIGNGTWAFSGNTIYPITDGSNIGITGTNRIGTIFMSSTLNYATSLIFSEAGTERGRFLAGGNLGINIAAPTALLHVKGTDSSTTVAFKYDNSGATNLISFRNDGFHSIGGSPVTSTRLYVKGSGTTSATNAIKIDNSAATALFQVRNNGTSGFGGVNANTTLSIVPASTFTAMVIGDVTDDTDAFVCTWTGGNGWEVVANTTELRYIGFLGDFSFQTDSGGAGGEFRLRSGGNIFVSGIPAYANNAAAIAGGLVTGDFYYTDTAGEFFLKLTH